MLTEPNEADRAISTECTEPIDRLWFGIDAHGVAFHTYGEWPIDGCQREYRLVEGE